jgi:capsular polysaccharide biosynthesis protein
MTTNAPRPGLYEDEIDLRELAATLWRQRWLVAALTVGLALAAGVGSTFFVAPLYESRTYIRLGEAILPTFSPQVGRSGEAIQTPFINPQGAARILTSASFLVPIARDQGLELTPAALEKAVRAEPVRDAPMVYLRIRHTDRVTLARFTDAVVRRFVDLASQDVHTRRATVQQRLAAVNAQMAEVERTRRLAREVLSQVQKGPSAGGSQEGFRLSFALSALSASDAAYANLLAIEQGLRRELATLEPPAVIVAPYVSPTPVSPRPLLNAVVAAGLGLFLSVFGAVVRAVWSPRRSPPPLPAREP